MWWGWRRARPPFWVWLLALWGLGRWMRWQSASEAERQEWRLRRRTVEEKLRKTIALWTETDRSSQS